MQFIKKFVFISCFVSLTTFQLHAGLVNAISIVVEKEPITLFEIYKHAKLYNIPTKDAVEVLVRQKLEISQIKNMGIEASEYEITKRFNEIATNNNMNIDSFTSALMSQNINIEDYKNEIKKSIQRERLYQHILRDKFQPIEKEELEKYYNANKNDFTRVESFDVTRLQSTDFNSLNQMVSLLTQDDSIESTRLRLYSASTEARIVSLLTNVNEGEMTPIVETKDGFVKFVVHKKTNESILPFEQAQNLIMHKISQDQEKGIIEDYFEKLKSRASITVIRMP